MHRMVKCLTMGFALSLMVFLNVNLSIAKTVDSDNDGWPDRYEEMLGSSPNDSKDTPDPLADNDQDGLVNEKERDYGTDPTDPDTDNDNLSDSQEVAWKKSDPRKFDTDNDGLNDFDEVLNGTNPRLPDSDGDEWLDKAEIDAGSDPNDYSSTPNGL